MADRTTAKEKMSMSFRITLAALAAIVASFTATAGAEAAQPVTSFELSTSTTQAGGHPDLTTSFSLEKPGEPEAAKDISVNLPTGVFGNPGAIQKCLSSDFVLSECAPGSQAGIITLYANHNGDPAYLLGTAPVFNMVRASETEVARLAFIAPTVKIPVTISVNVRTAVSTDYGLKVKVAGIPQTIPVNHVDLTIWGLPAHPSHDAQRFPKGSPGNPPGCAGMADTSCTGGIAAAQQVLPYTQNPSICTGVDLPANIEVQTYQDPDHPSSAPATLPATTGCENQQFKPVLNGGLTTNETDSASGMDLQLKADQFLSTAPSPSELRSATIVMPKGLTINPDAADGQSACSDLQAGFGSDAPGNCPDNSKVGTIEVRTPALDGPLNGSLFFGEPKSGDQYRLFMIFSGFGLNAKLFASLKPDPVTGQLTVTMIDLPQVPIEEFNLHLFSSDRGIMATPTHCTIYQVDATFVPWNGTLSPQPSRPTFGLESGPGGSSCPGIVRPFNPRLAAGMSNSLGGAYSAFTLKLDREDGDQFLRDLTFRMPPGFTGDLSGITYCSEGAIAAAAGRLGREELAGASCPASSQIGTTNVAAGPGTHPFHAFGKMYLAGPIKGAPLSVVAVTPALAGPYDYGTVVVRVALHVDPLTAQVFAASDTVPSIIGGIPIRMRSIQVNIDKPNFTINPTNCEPSSVASQGIGDQGTVTDFSSYFQAVNCASLPFKPKMTVKLIGKKGTKRAKNPQMQFDLRTRSGDANIKSLSVTLSHAFEIDQRHLGNICSEKELTEDQCAGRTPIGKATTTTPLLDQPLSGPAYAVSGSGGLPRLAFVLNGQVNLVPRAETKTTPGGQLKTTVPVVPDAPIGHFRLNVFGGKTGYLINTRNLCANTPVTKIAYTGQNGKTRSESVKLQAGCGKKKPRAKRHGR